MWCKHWIVLPAVWAIGVTGCGCSDEAGQESVKGQSAAERSAGGAQANATGTPEAAVTEFLEAVRTGDDERTAMMLTATAREKTAELNMQVAPPGSDTATFEVGKAQYLNEDGARVASQWSDLNEDSQRRTDEIVWMVRREQEGWRIGGVAATVFEGEPPLLLDFEKPEEMLKKQRWVQEEIRRRTREQNSQVQKPENEDNPIRR